MSWPNRVNFAYGSRSQPSVAQTNSFKTNDPAGLATRSEFRTLFLKKKQTNDVVLAWRRPKWLNARFVTFINRSLRLSRSTNPQIPLSLFSPPAAAPLVTGFWKSPPFFALRGAISSPRRPWLLQLAAALIASGDFRHRTTTFSGLWNFVFSGICLNFLSFIL